MPWILLHQTWKTNLPWPMTPQYQSRDYLHTTTQNVADEPTWSIYPPGTRSEMTCIPLHKTWQINLLWLNTVAKVWKLYHSQFLRYPTAFSQNTFLLRKWLSFVPRAPDISTSKFSGMLNTMARFESSSIHHFWDTPQHLLKTHFCLESGFLLFLELQKSLLVSFQGCWTQ